MSNHLQEPLTNYPKPVLTNDEQEADEKMVSLQAESIVNTVAFPMVLKAALELGVVDVIVAAGNGAWLSPSEIAGSLPTKPMNPEASVLLDRILRLLVSHSILKCRHLKDVILEGKDAFSSAHGMKLFEYINLDERFGEVFHRAMSESSTMVMKKVLEVYRGFENVNTLVDVGGATGTILGLVTSKYPHIKGVNFDLPQVLTHAPFYPGVKHVSGDMFLEIPKGDAIFMKWILHDWTDEDCIKILKNCWKSLLEEEK
ncbi:unnamed protein product [Thlaspi arvense]|uniref:O-methyltransferase C-terminal domain-containing protein n=1 Tax=Thlaspi arvense TaxID=13288 RepID=A0AAU9SPT6_THLAR|nr:unnamed protein product [Thlaspi arvense]